MVTKTKGVDPRVKRTRQLLQRALIDLVQEKQFASITVQDIAERATLNRATFYAHFEDKYELLCSIMREQFQREVADKLLPASSGGVHALRVLIGSMFDYISEAAHYRCQSASTQHEPLFEVAVQQELDKLILNWLKQIPGLGTAWKVPLGTMALVMSWAIFGAAVQWSRGEKTPPKEQVVEQVLITLTEGVVQLIPSLGAHLRSLVDEK